MILSVLIVLISIAVVVSSVRLAVRIVQWVRKNRPLMAELGVGFVVQDALASWASGDDGTPPSPDAASHHADHGSDGGSHGGCDGGTLSL